MKTTIEVSIGMERGGTIVFHPFVGVKNCISRQCLLLVNVVSEHREGIGDLANSRSSSNVCSTSMKKNG
jgi:hypothetical protein